MTIPPATYTSHRGSPQQLTRLLEKGWRTHTYNRYYRELLKEDQQRTSLRSTGPIGVELARLEDGTAAANAQQAPHYFARLQSILPPQGPRLILWTGGFTFSLFDFAISLIPAIGQVRLLGALIGLAVEMLRHPDKIDEILDVLKAEVGGLVGDFLAVFDAHSPPLNKNTYQKGKYAGTFIATFIFILWIWLRIAPKAWERLKTFASKMKVSAVVNHLARAPTCHHWRTHSTTSRSARSYSATRDWSRSKAGCSGHCSL